jgi:hypothetical protein
LETRPVPPRYWLSARAAAGILRRAERRGKELPLALQQALTALASTFRDVTMKMTTTSSSGVESMEAACGR